MSVIVAVTKGPHTILASDSLTSFGDDQRVPSENSMTSKIRPIGDALLGSAGWAVYDRILDDHLGGAEPPQLQDEVSIFRFFMDLWKAMHDRYAFVNDQASSRETPFGDLDSSFLVGSRGGIFKVSHDMDVCRFRRYYAIGSGSLYALGAMHALYDGNADASDIAKRGVAAACAYDAYCGGEVQVFTVE